MGSYGPQAGTVKKLKPLVRTIDSRVCQPERKRVDPFYLTAEYRQWREAVIARAGRRCQAVEDGERCAKAEPEHRLFADHIVELSDGGAPLDPANGRCLCGSHHTLKTTATRARRLGGGGD